MYEPKEVTPDECNEIIQTREPKGLFWVKDGDIYVGIDSTTAEAWTQDFSTLKDCLAWLSR